MTKAELKDIIRECMIEEGVIEEKWIYNVYPDIHHINTDYGFKIKASDDEEAKEIAKKELEKRNISKGCKYSVDGGIHNKEIAHFEF